MEEIGSEEWTTQPPAQERVAQRAIVLATLAYRGRLDPQAQNAQAVALWDKIKGWFYSLNIESELETAEDEILAAPFGTLSPSQAMNSGWRTEGAGVLAWALNCYKLPKTDETSNINELSGGLGFLQSLNKSALHIGKLRSFNDLEHYGSVALTVHWRLRQFGIRPEPVDFEDFVRGAQWGPLSLKGVKLY